MRVVKIIVLGMFAAFFFTGFFAVFAAAEGTSFDDAKEIGEGTFSGTVANGTSYYYKVTVPAYKAILVTLEAGTDSDVTLTMYDESKQQVGLGALASNGETDKGFYDGKSTADYLIYLKISDMKIFGISKYTIKVEFRPSDVMSGAELINDGQKISDTLKASLEVHWYKINVPKGEILNVSFSSSRGEIMIALYDQKGDAIDSNIGTLGYVDTKLLGQSGTIYIKVTSFEFQNQDVSYTITPKLVKGSSEVEQTATGFSMMCIGGVLVVIIVIVLIVYLIVRKKKGSS
ncbi:MAG: hypothetical protein DRP20_04850 [Thermotogae bacterium]|nr:MAG: hypothetical protein DRP20_04850 [Thermotogota bacterium]